MSEQVISVLDAICEKFGIAVDWTQENIMPYVQTLFEKYIRYEIATSIAWCFVFIILTVISYTFANKFHKKAMALDIPYDDDYPESLAAFIFWLCAAVFGIIAIIVTFTQAFDIVTCVTFPEKIILEYAKSLMR